MLRNLYLLSLLVTALAPPLHYRVRLWMDAPPALAAESAQVSAALERGLYVDSLILPPQSGASTSLAAPRDSAGFANMAHSALIVGALSESNGMVEVRLTLKNVLARVVAGPDTIRVSRSGLDSVMVARGQAYARILTRR
jgi:hypothetical protein